MKFKISTLLVLALCLVSAQLSAQAFYTEDFSDQAAFEANWTNGGDNEGAEVWTWSDDPGIATFGAQPDFGSATAENGFILFNSDANGEASHDVTITSPAIDCSGQSSVFLRCENQYAFFSAAGISVAQVGVSTDGENFIYYDILTNVISNDLSAAVQVASVELPEAANQPEVYLQFRWQGFFEYSWKIDDITLEGADPTPLNDLVILQPAIAANYSMPFDQIDTVEFINIIENRGLDAQTNVTTEVEITGDNGDSFMTSATVLDNIDPGVQDTTEFAETFVPSGEGVYTLSYTVAQDEADGVPGDNGFDSEFVISDGLFAKDNGVPASATQPAEFAGATWEMGNYYIIQNEGYIAGSISFSVASNGDVPAHQGQDVSIFLYRIDDNGDANFDDEDVTLVGFNTHTFTTEENFDLITVDILNPLNLEPGVELEPAEYIATVEYTQDMFCPYSELAYYWDISTVVKDGQWFLGGFGPETTAIVRLNKAEMVNTNDNVQLLAGKIQVTPNPASTMVDVNIDLEEASDLVNVTVRNLQGKEVLSRELNNISSETVQFDVTSLPAGTYLVHVQTEAGFRTQRLVIQR